MSYKINVIINKDKHGYYAYCPELPGCHSQGKTFEDILSNIKEATELYLETMTKKEIKEALSKEIVTTNLEVEIA